MDSWVRHAYDVIAVLGVGLVLYDMQMTEHDRINRLAPTWLQQVRRGSFVLMGLLLLYSVWNRDPICLPTAMIVWSGIFALLINGIALSLRKPTNHHRPSGTLTTVFSRWASICELFVSFRQGVRK
jgi:hypothetical protein